MTGPRAYMNIIPRPIASWHSTVEVHCVARTVYGTAGWHGGQRISKRRPVHRRPSRPRPSHLGVTTQGNERGQNVRTPSQPCFMHAAAPIAKKNDACLPYRGSA